MENSRYRDKEKAGGQQTREKTINLVSHPRSPLSQKMALLLKDGWTCTQTNTSPNRKERQMEVGTKRGKEKETTSHCVPAFSSSSTFRACFRRHAKRKRAKKKNANNLGRNKKNKVTQTLRLAFFSSFFVLYRRTRGAASLVSFSTTPVLFSLVRVPSASTFVGYAASRRVSPRPRYNAPLKKQDEPKLRTCARASVPYSFPLDMSLCAETGDVLVVVVEPTRVRGRVGVARPFCFT